MPRLTSLDAIFVRWTADGIQKIGSSTLGSNGVMFRCPVSGHGHMVIVWFLNPIGCETAPSHAYPTSRWQRIGETLDTLTLAPSIDIPGDWHGFVLSGDVT